MQELRFVAVSEDGSYAVLAVPGRSGRFILSIDERLRAVAMGQTSRLAQYEIEVESPLRPKEIQARIRAGETAEEIADAAGIPVERVRWFEGPVLAERAYIADQAQAASVRRAGDGGGPGSRLGDIVPERLTASGATPEDGQWDSRKRGDGNWQVTLTFPSAGRLHVAEWVFDPRRRHVMPDDDNAARLSLPESELPPEPVVLPGEATVTPLAPRLGAAAGMGGGGIGGAGGFAGGGSGVGVRSFRPERSVIPDRSLGADRSLADRPMSDRPMSPAAASGSASGSGSAAERAGVPDRPGLAHSPAATPVLPRPPYHDHTDFRDGDGQAAAHRAAAPGSGATGTDGRRGVDDATPVETVPVTAPPYVFDEPAGDDRGRMAPPRQVVFEEPAAGFFDEQLEPGTGAPAGPAPHAAAPSSSSGFVGGEVAQGGAAAASAAPAASGVQAPAASAPAAPAAPAAPVPAPAAPAGSVNAPAAPAAPAIPADAAPAQSTATPAASAPAVPASALAPAVAPAEAASAGIAAKPAGRAEDGTSAQPQAGSAAPLAPVASSAGPAESASRVDIAQAAAPAAQSATTSAGSAAAEGPIAAAAHVPAQPEAAPASPAGRSAAAAPAEPASTPTATSAAAKAPAVPAAAAAQPEAAAAAKPAPAPEPAPQQADKPEAAEEQAARPRPAAKKNAKGRRSSVPSWDEIMLGSSRQRD